MLETQGHKINRVPSLTKRYNVLRLEVDRRRQKGYRWQSSSLCPLQPNGPASTRSWLLLPLPSPRGLSCHFRAQPTPPSTLALITPTGQFLPSTDHSHSMWTTLGGPTGSPQGEQLSKALMLLACCLLSHLLFTRPCAMN